MTEIQTHKEVALFETLQRRTLVHKCHSGLCDVKRMANVRNTSKWPEAILLLSLNTYDSKRHTAVACPGGGCRQTDRQTPVNTLSSRILRNAGGKNLRSRTKGLRCKNLAIAITGRQVVTILTTSRNICLLFST